MYCDYHFQYDTFLFSANKPTNSVQAEKCSHYLLAALHGVAACPGVRVDLFLSQHRVHRPQRSEQPKRDGRSGVFWPPVPRLNRCMGESCAAISSATSSQPAIAAADRKLGVKSIRFSTPCTMRFILGVLGNDSRLEEARCSSFLSSPQLSAGWVRPVSSPRDGHCQEVGSKRCSAWGN